MKGTWKSLDAIFGEEERVAAEAEAARLMGRRPEMGATRDGIEHVCPIEECERHKKGRGFDTAQGAALHRMRAHGAPSTNGTRPPKETPESPAPRPAPASEPETPAPVETPEQPAPRPAPPATEDLGGGQPLFVTARLYDAVPIVLLEQLGTRVRAVDGYIEVLA